MAAAKANKTHTPTTTEMMQWQHGQCVDEELADFDNAITMMQDVLSQSGKGSIAPPDAENAKSLIARCATSRTRRGAVVSTGTPGEYVAIAHLLRMAANIENKGDCRNLLERFAKQGQHRKGAIKDIPSYEQGLDLRTGETILAVFRAGDADVPLFYVGQVRQIIAAMSSTVKKRQVFLSVPSDDATAVILCYPWAQVEGIGGQLMTCEEPIEYYRVVSARPADAARTAGARASRLVATEIEVGGDEDESGEVEVVKVSGSSVLLRSVSVDWQQCVLKDSASVVCAMENAHVL